MMTVLDLSSLTEMFEGNQGGLGNVLQRYAVAVRDDLDALQTEVQTRNQTAVKTLAHRIKGAAMVVGAMRVRHLSTRIEGALDGDWKVIDKKTQELALAVEEVERAIRARAAAAP
jgi:two-component system sensor histidine kinase EvgS